MNCNVSIPRKLGKTTIVTQGMLRVNYSLVKTEKACPGQFFEFGIKFILLDS